MSLAVSPVGSSLRWFIPIIPRGNGGKGFLAYDVLARKIGGLGALIASPVQKRPSRRAAEEPVPPFGTARMRQFFVSFLVEKFPFEGLQTSLIPTGFLKKSACFTQDRHLHSICSIIPNLKQRWLKYFPHSAKSGRRLFTCELCNSFL